MCRISFSKGGFFEGYIHPISNNGFGRYIKSDGSYYIGEVKDGLILHGKGKICYADGMV